MGISVLMSIYKKEKPEYFRETMESILAQTRQPEEIVLIEDGTLTPELDAVIEEYQKRCSNLKVYPHKENQMLGRALAEGVTLCSYELIARMDTDDVMMPKRLECCQNERISTYRQQILIPNCDYYSSCFCDFLIHTLTPLLFLLVKLLFILLFSIATIHFICSVLSLRYHTCFVTYSSVFMHNVSIF